MLWVSKNLGTLRLSHVKESCDQSCFNLAFGDNDTGVELLCSSSEPSSRSNKSLRLGNSGISTSMYGKSSKSNSFSSSNTSETDNKLNIAMCFVMGKHLFWSFDQLRLKHASATAASRM